MPTGSEFVNAMLKRFLSQNRISNEIIEYLQENSFDIQKRIFPQQGLFTYPVTITYGTGVFSVSEAGAGAIEGTDGEGHTLSLALSRQSSIPFEDDGSSTYWIGMKYIEIPNGIYDNPRTGKPEYDKIMEEIGELDNPDLVTDGTTTITFRVNDLFPSGEDNSGRIVRVWLVNPQSADPAVAFEDCTVAFSSPNNTITTTGTLGQSTISTNPADYQVACLGVSVVSGVTNPFSSDYVILGNIDSSQTAPAGTDISDQVDYGGGGGHTLQKAYDGVGSGSGRLATLNDGAIELGQENDTIYEHDVHHAIMRLRKNLDTAIMGSADGVRNTEMGIVAHMRTLSRGGFVQLTSIHDATGGGKLNPSEAIQVTTAGDTISFTRGGTLDLFLTSDDLQIWENVDLVEITGSVSGNDGVYYITNVASSSSLDLIDLVGTAASLAQEIGNANLKASIYRQTFNSGSRNGGIEIRGLQDMMQDNSLDTESIYIGLPANAGDTDEAIVLYRASGSPRILKIFSNGDIETDGELRAHEDVVAKDSAVIGDSIEIASASGGRFLYQDWTAYSKLIHPFDGEYNSGAGWNKTVAAGTRGYISSAGSVAEVIFSFTLPAGYRLTNVQVMMNPGGNNSTLYLQEYTGVDWSSPAIGSVTNLLAAPGYVQDATSGVIVKTLTPETTETIDGDHHYHVLIIPNATGTTTVYGLKVNFTVKNVGHS